METDFSGFNFRKILKKNLSLSNFRRMNRYFLFLLIPCILLSSPAIWAAESNCTLSIPDLFKRVSPSVVGITAFRIDPFKLFGRFDFSVGTGLIIQTDGLILTSSHVVYNAKSISVTLTGNQTVEATLVGADPILDIAVIRISVSDNNLHLALLGDSDRLRVGEEVSAIGNPLSMERRLSAALFPA